MRVFVLTDSPSPYQVEFFNEIEARGVGELRVGYLRRRDPERQWNAQTIRHDALELDSANGALQHARDEVRRADLVVFNYYRHAHAEKLIAQRAAYGGPWCFWGERPGLRQPAWAGRLLRKWKLSKLHASAAPIWGIGEFAVAGYRSEFGTARSYFNLPYFSDLERFKPRITRTESAQRVFLFSGSLIERKGVDLLARAFVRLAGEAPKVTLKIAGEGTVKEGIRRTLDPVRERVEFVGFKDWSALPDLYASADVLCVPSRYDGWGLVVPEGLASGLPVIATDRMGAALEFIRTRENGWLIPAGDEDAILSAMREAVSISESALGQMGRRASRSVSEHTLGHGVDRFVRYARKSLDV